MKRKTSVSDKPDNAASTKFTAFISYSRQDSHIVTPLVNLLRVFGDPIFRDADTIQPGSRWQFEIATAIEQCKIILVFWCVHSRDSREVRKEYARAVKLGKAVVPVLLDSTVMVRDISRYQAIDLREALGEHAHHDVTPRVKASWPKPHKKVAVKPTAKKAAKKTVSPKMQNGNWKRPSALPAASAAAAPAASVRVLPAEFVNDHVREPSRITPISLINAAQVLVERLRSPFVS